MGYQEKAPQQSDRDWSMPSGRGKKNFDPTPTPPGGPRKPTFYFFKKKWSKKVSPKFFPSISRARRSPLNFKNKFPDREGCRNRLKRRRPRKLWQKISKCWVKNDKFIYFAISYLGSPKSWNDPVFFLRMAPKPSIWLSKKISSSVRTPNSGSIGQIDGWIEIFLFSTDFKIFNCY